MIIEEEEPRIIKLVSGKEKELKKLSHHKSLYIVTLTSTNANNSNVHFTLEIDEMKFEVNKSDKYDCGILELSSESRAKIIHSNSNHEKYRLNFSLAYNNKNHAEIWK